MKPVTQILRAFIEPDKKPRKQRKRSEAASQFEQLFYRAGSAPSSDDEPWSYERRKQDADKLKAMLGPEASPWFAPMLCFDCETTTGLGQKLRFGVFQDRGHDYRYLQTIACQPGRKSIPWSLISELRSEGIFYNPLICTHDEIETMRAYAEEHKLRFMTRDEFVREVFFRMSVIRWKTTTIPEDIISRLVIGHNLPFDLGALSLHAGPSQNENYGGLTLTLDESGTWRSDVRVKKLGFGKHMYECSRSVNGMPTLKFLDTMQLGRALLGPGAGSLKKLGQRLGIVDADKGEADLNGPITREFIEYCRADVQRTWRVFEELRLLYRKHGVSQDIDRIYSEASLGKAYLTDLGITPFLKQNPNFPRQLIGPFMESSYGGRSEVHINHQLLEGLLADHKSQYPTVNTLMNLQELNIAEKVEAIEDGPLGTAATFLRNVSPDELQQKETWPKLRGVALIRPNGDILPVRTIYYPDEDATTERAQQVGLNVVMSGPPTWYTFADIISSKLLTGKCPDILKTIELKPVGVQSGLKKIRFFGDDKYAIDLRLTDFFQRVIEMRSGAKQEIAEIKRRLAEDKLLTETHELALEPIRLGAMEKGLKLLANSTAFGMLIEFITDEHKDETPTSIYHGMAHTRKIARKQDIADDGGIEISGYKVERPGKWFAPWGPLIPAGGRLLMAIAELLGRGRGLTYGFGDTDSQLIARPEGMSRDRFRTLALEIAGPNGWFQKLNPYEGGGEPLFNLEDVNFHWEDKDRTGPLEPLFMLGISAKRYALANFIDGRWIIRKASGHGLAHISAPEYDKSFLPQHPASFKLEKDTTSPLWFGVRGVWDCGALCNGENPKLFCDLWRIAFEAASTAEPGQVRKAIEKAINEALPTMPGLDAPQWSQRALSGRAEWQAYAPNMPEARAFMFFALLPGPLETSSFVPKDCDSLMELAEFDKQRADLMGTSLYGAIVPATKDMPQHVDLNSLRRRDNNKFPAEIFDPAYGLRLQTVADSLTEYFSHGEFKSLGVEGQRQRRKLHVLDHEYIGKETNALIDPADENIWDDVHEPPGATILQTGCNGGLIGSLVKVYGLEVVANAAGVKPGRIQAIVGASARASSGRLNEAAMRRLRNTIIVDDVSGRARLALPEPEGSYSEAEAIRRKLRGDRDERAEAAKAAVLKRRLVTLHDAIAKGKDFDLDAPNRRSALKNVRRGTASLTDLQTAIERHIDPADATALEWLPDGLANAWRGNSNSFEGFPQIERAIELASGAARAERARIKQNSYDKTRALRREAEFEQRRLKREARKAKVATILEASPPEPKPMPPVPRTKDGFLDIFDEKFASLMAQVMVFIFVAYALLRSFRPGDFDMARKAALRKASPETAIHVFFETLVQRATYREHRRVSARQGMRKLRRGEVRSAIDDADHPSGGGLQSVV